MKAVQRNYVNTNN